MCESYRNKPSMEYGMFLDKGPLKALKNGKNTKIEGQRIHYIPPGN